MAINAFTPAKSPIEAISNALSVVNQIQGIRANSATLEKAAREEKQAAEAQAKLDKLRDPASEESKAYREAYGAIDPSSPISDTVSGYQLIQQRGELPKLYEKKMEQSFKNQGDTFKKSGDLRGEYQKLSQRTTVVNEAYKKIEAGTKSKSPMSDVSLVYNVIKMFDPGSAVKEGEIDLARAAQSVPSQLLSAWERAKSGQSLGDNVRDDILSTANHQMRAQLDAQKVYDDFYSARAKEQGINPEQIVFPWQRPQEILYKKTKETSAGLSVPKVAPGQPTPDEIAAAQAELARRRGGQ